MIKKFIASNYLLVTIIILASFCRLYRINDYMEFLGDQGRDVVIVRNFLITGRPFFIGPQTSIGNMYLGPFYYYLIALPLLVANFNPVGPSVFVALMGILTVYLMYFISARWFNRSVALISSFLFAISPTVIKYSDFSWNPNVMPLFALLFMYFVYEAIHQKKYQYFIYSSIFFSLALNSHYLALLLLIPTFIYFFIHFIKSNQKLFILKYLAISAGVFLLFLSPQILFDIKHHGQNINSIIYFFTHRETTVNIKLYKSIPLLWPLFQQINTSLIAGKYTTPGLIISLLFVLALIFYFVKSKKKTFPFWYLLWWYFTGIVGLGLYKQHIYDHYFGFLFPVVFILISLIIEYLYHQQSIFKIFAVITFLLISISSVLNNPFRYAPNSQMANVQKIDKFILSKSNQQPFNFALLAKQNYDPPYKYFFYLSKSPIFDLHDKMTNQLFVVCEPWQIECKPINNPQWEIAAYGWSKIDSQWQIGDITIFKLVHNPSGQPNSK